MNKKILAVVIVGILLIGGCATAFVLMKGNNKDSISVNIYDGYYANLLDAKSLALVDANDDTASSLSVADRVVDLGSVSPQPMVYGAGDQVDGILCKTTDGIHFEKMTLTEKSSSENPDEEIDPEWTITSMAIAGRFMFLSVDTKYHVYEQATAQEMYDKYGFCWNSYLYYMVSLDSGKVFLLNSMVDATFSDDNGKVTKFEGGLLSIYRAEGNTVFCKVRSYTCATFGNPYRGYSGNYGAHSLTVDGNVLTSKMILNDSGNMSVRNIYRNGVTEYNIGENKYIWMPDSKTAMSYDRSTYSSLDGYLVKNAVMDGDRPVSYERLNADGTHTTVVLDMAGVKSYYDKLSEKTLISKKTSDDSTTWTYVDITNGVGAVKVTLNNDGSVNKDVLKIDLSRYNDYNQKEGYDGPYVLKIDNSMVKYGELPSNIGNEYSYYRYNLVCYVSGTSLLWMDDTTLRYIDTENWVKGELTDPNILQFSSIYMNSGSIIVGGKTISMADFRGEVKSDLTLNLSYKEPDYTIITIYSIN